MLQELHITNIAIIKELEIVFSPGLNVLTGETGAGKTIILNALGLILGSRSDFEIIRTGEKSGKVQAIISGHSPRFIQDKLRELGLEPDASGELIIIREIDSSGKSKAKVNGERILLGQLQDLTGNMIDIHSQHQHQSLLQPEFQLEILDGYAGLEDRLNRFSKLLTEYREIVRKIEKAEAEREQTLKQKEFFEFELKKIEDIAPEPGEDTRIKNELQVIKNSELLYEKISGSLDLLFDNETSIYNSVNSVILDNSRTSEIDDGIRECISRLREVQAEIKDISMFFRDYIKKLDFSPEHIEELNLRLSQLNDLKLRFKKDLDSILVYGE
ncbi:MAG TPA: hypothetical protein ENN73_05760, partial [Firmicutes bacterium]|nr:hypothetical protein [Bacillota bacterium]